jgi:hypothetical protein
MQDAHMPAWQEYGRSMPGAARPPASSRAAAGDAVHLALVRDLDLGLVDAIGGALAAGAG